MSVEWGRGEFSKIVSQLAENKSLAVSQLAKEVGLPEEKVSSVIEKLGLTEITRFQAEGKAQATARSSVEQIEVFRIGRNPIFF
jgi:hypothetical protein